MTAPHPPADAGRDGPALLFDLAVAYWRSAALFSGLELGIFAALGSHALSLASLGERTGVPARTLRLLVDALRALNLLAGELDGELSNAPVARAYLLPDAPGYLGETILFNARSYPAWGRLTEAIREGRPAMNTAHFLGDDAAATRNFVYAMHHRATGVARCLVGMLDLSGVRRLLDVGGGPGTYSMLLAERFPQLTCTVTDLPGVLAVAAEIVADSPARERLQLCAGDLFHDDFGGDFDVVLISGVAHRTEGASTVALFRKAAAALRPGGRLAVSDLFTGGAGNGPVLPELFSLHMMLTANQGQSLPLAKMEQMCADAGLQFISSQAYPPPLPHTLCLATKPA